MAIFGCEAGVIVATGVCALSDVKWDDLLTSFIRGVAVFDETRLVSVVAPVYSESVSIVDTPDCNDDDGSELVD